MKLGALVVFVAACGGPKGAIGNQQGGTGSPDWLERSLAFAPVTHKDPLAKYSVPLDKAAALIKALPVNEEHPIESRDQPDRQHAYDFDGDGQPDMVTFGETMFGPSEGTLAFLRKGAALEPTPVIATSGAWVDARETPDAVAMRIETLIIAPGEARYSQTIAYNKKTHAWSAVIQSYGAMQGKVGAAGAAFTAFETVGPATLRAAPAVDDAPVKQEIDEVGGGIPPTTTLRGNVLATYEGKARGVIVASEGDWRYVAFDPATRPKETSLQHGMNHGPMPAEGAPEPPPNQLTTNTWLLGWVKAAEIR